MGRLSGGHAQRGERERKEERGEIGERNRGERNGEKEKEKMEGRSE